MNAWLLWLFCISGPKPCSIQCDIDILSIDIEGYEVNALKGLDFSLVKPLVIVIESENTAHEQELDSILSPQGYIKSTRVSENIFFVLDPAFHQRIRDKVFTNIKVTHTQHPLDSGGDQGKFITIKTSSEVKNIYEDRGVFSRLIERLKALKTKNFYR